MNKIINKFHFFLFLAVISFLLLTSSMWGLVFASSMSMVAYCAVLSIVLFVSLATISAIRKNSAEKYQSEINKKLDLIHEAMQLSENAKRILFRDRELLLLRNTVHDDIEKGDFHAALILCDQMANVFGAVEESEEMRSRVQEIIHQHHQDRIQQEMVQLKQLLEKHQWVEAYQYAAKLRRLFPESPLLHGLEQQIANVRTQYRHSLEENFLQSAKNDEVENAMCLLQELDGYLTPEEARRFRDTAASVIETYRESLTVKFKMAVKDHRWKESIDFGEEIIRQFPNSQMSVEVTEILEPVRARVLGSEATS